MNILIKIKMKITLISRPESVRTPKSWPPKDHIPFASDLGVFKSGAQQTISKLSQYLLFQSHDCVYSEVATLTGVSDTHWPWKEQSCSQNL